MIVFKPSVYHFKACTNIGTKFGCVRARNKYTCIMVYFMKIEKFLFICQRDSILFSIALVCYRSTWGINLWPRLCNLWTHAPVYESWLSFRVWYVSFATLPYVALLHLDGIKAVLSHVALLFLTLLQPCCVLYMTQCKWRDIRRLLLRNIACIPPSLTIRAVIKQMVVITDAYHFCQLRNFIQHAVRVNSWIST